MGRGVIIHFTFIISVNYRSCWQVLTLLANTAGMCGSEMSNDDFQCWVLRSKILRTSYSGSSDCRGLFKIEKQDPSTAELALECRNGVRFAEMSTPAKSFCSFTGTSFTIRSEYSGDIVDTTPRLKRGLSRGIFLNTPFTAMVSTRSIKFYSECVSQTTAVGWCLLPASLFFFSNAWDVLHQMASWIMIIAVCSNGITAVQNGTMQVLSFDHIAFNILY